LSLGPLLFVKFSLADFGIQTRDVATNSFKLERILKQVLLENYFLDLD
jgi:hypothetical protein